MASEKEVLKQKVVELDCNLRIKSEDFETKVQLELEPVQREVETIRMVVSAKETEVRTLQDTVELIEEEREALEKEVQNKTAETAVLKEKVVELDTSLKTRVEEFESAVSLRLEPVEREVERIQMQVADKEAEVSILHNSIVNINSEKEVLKQKIVELETDMKTKEAEFASSVQLKIEAVEEQMNQVSEAEVTILKNKLDEFETAMAESSKTIAKLEENLFGKQEELAEMVSSVEQMKVIELERKELVVVLQEKEEVEAGLRRQVAELQEMLQEQGNSRQSLVANLEAARQEVEAAMLQRTRLEAEMKEKSAQVEEVTRTASVRLEKCKVVELELEESTRAQKELGVKMIRHTTWAPPPPTSTWTHPRSQILTYPPLQCRGNFSQTIFIFLGSSSGGEREGVEGGSRSSGGCGR